MGSSTSRVLTRTDSTPVAGENKERVSSLALLVHRTICPRLNKPQRMQEKSSTYIIVGWI
jgi:hypothetical protein